MTSKPLHLLAASLLAPTRLTPINKKADAGLESENHQGHICLLTAVSLAVGDGVARHAGKAASVTHARPPFLAVHLSLPGLPPEDASPQGPDPSQAVGQMPLFMSLTAPSPTSEGHLLPRPSLSFPPSPRTCRMRTPG